MPFLIGTDEAGYGPNLGPLTVCGTLWNVADTSTDLYGLLSDSLSQNTDDPNKLSVCDSKHIYSSSGSIKHLETSVLSFVYSMFGEIPKSAGEFLLLLGLDLPQHNSRVWDSITVDLPIAADPESIMTRSRTFDQDCLSHGARLVDVSCIAIFPEQFNTLCEKYGNKAELLSFITLNCVELLKRKCSDKTRIVCDKHGGRSKYAPMLNQYLTDEFISVLVESREISSYRWRENNDVYDIHFQSKGESFLPTALSSMFAKYTRELCMEVWNRFWQSKVPGIRPTKGYPVDAKRFKSEIAQQQMELGIRDESIWRTR